MTRRPAPRALFALALASALASACGALPARAEGARPFALTPFVFTQSAVAMPPPLSIFGITGLTTTQMDIAGGGLRLECGLGAGGVWAWDLTAAYGAGSTREVDDIAGEPASLKLHLRHAGVALGVNARVPAGRMSVQFGPAAFVETGKLEQDQLAPGTSSSETGRALLVIGAETRLGLGVALCDHAELATEASGRLGWANGHDGGANVRTMAFEPAFRLGVRLHR